MKREEQDLQGNNIEETLDDNTKPRHKPVAGGGGGPATPGGYMETFDVMEGAHPTHALPKPYNEDEEDAWPTKK